MAFEDYSRYSDVNFSHLNYRIKDKKIQEKYIQDWKHRYAKVFKEGGEEQAFLWNIRVYKALKEVFTSSSFYLESLIAKESRSWTAFYFLSYYSLFHALLSCVFLLPDETMENLSVIKHSKMIKVFDSHFCTKKPNIINCKIVEVYALLKFLREYYSYNMPPNDFLYGYNGDIKPDYALPMYLRSCFQLANLLSELIESAYEKHGKDINVKSKYYKFVTKYFYMVNGCIHPKTGKHILHYVDEIRMKETLDFPAPISFVIELEHFTDEFRHYEGAEFPQKADGSKINPSSFVYNAIR